MYPTYFNCYWRAITVCKNTGNTNQNIEMLIDGGVDIFTDLYYFPTKTYLNDYIVMPYSKENNIAYPFIHIRI